MPHSSDVHASDEFEKIVLQEPQLGTGHALQQTLPHLPAEGSTLVLYGDVPLMRTHTLSRVLSHPQTLCLLTATLDDSTGYGRIVRDRDGKVARIVEERDANAIEKEIREINTGVLAAPNEALRDWLGKLQCHNTQGEYYLTDIVALARRRGHWTERGLPLWQTSLVTEPATVAAPRSCRLRLDRPLTQSGSAPSPPAQTASRSGNLELRPRRSVMARPPAGFLPGDWPLEQQAHVRAGSDMRLRLYAVRCHLRTRSDRLFAGNSAGKFAE
jgi:hypothetical protein